MRRALAFSVAIGLASSAAVRAQGAARVAAVLRRTNSLRHRPLSDDAAEAQRTEPRLAHAPAADDASAIANGEKRVRVASLQLPSAVLCRSPRAQWLFAVAKRATAATAATEKS